MVTKKTKACPKKNMTKKSTPKTTTRTKRNNKLVRVQNDVKTVRLFLRQEYIVSLLALTILGLLGYKVYNYISYISPDPEKIDAIKQNINAINNLITQIRNIANLPDSQLTNDTQKYIKAFVQSLKPQTQGELKYDIAKDVVEGAKNIIEEQREKALNQAGKGILDTLNPLNYLPGNPSPSNQPDIPSSFPKENENLSIRQKLMTNPISDLYIKDFVIGWEKYNIFSTAGTYGSNNVIKDLCDAGKLKNFIDTYNNPTSGYPLKINLVNLDLILLNLNVRQCNALRNVLQYIRDNLV